MCKGCSNYGLPITIDILVAPDQIRDEAVGH
ncbi:MAG: hypothetical protein ACMUEM_06700 [Flavobacteriales bacterium AspAUS03]